jgi:hypothetical protein
MEMEVCDSASNIRLTKSFRGEILIKRLIIFTLFGEKSWIFKEKLFKKCGLGQGANISFLGLTGTKFCKQSELSSIA